MTWLGSLALSPRTEKDLRAWCARQRNWHASDGSTHLWRITIGYEPDQVPNVHTFLRLRDTQKGCWIRADDSDYFGLLPTERFVLSCDEPAFLGSNGKVNSNLPKRFAYATIEQALTSYVIRQRLRVRYAEAHMAAARESLEMAHGLAAVMADEARS